MATYKHIRSNVDSKRPTTSLADGQIAINTNVASPGVFFKDSAGTGIVKVGPVHVGTTAPNSTPGVGGSTGNSKGEQWLDTSLTPAQLKVWNGSAWVGVVADELPVSKLQNGSAYQLLQTDAAGTGVEWASNIDVPGSLNVTSTAVFDSTVSHPLGSAAAPTITFTGDANTGIYSPGIDQVAITTGGTGRLFVAANGNLGIGINAPTQLLHLNSTNPTPLKIESSGDLSQIQFKTSGGSNLYVGSTSVNDFVVKNTVSGSTQERFRITGAGNCGIGVTNPQAKLTVEGSQNADPTAGRNPISDIYIQNLGGTEGLNNYGASIGFSRINKTRRGAMIAGVQSSSDPDQGGLAFFTKPSTTSATDVVVEQVRIDHNGNVGINTNNPSQKLSVTGNGTFTGTVSAQGSVLTSDQRFKTNITDANSQLNDVTALGNSLRNWDWTEDAPVADKDTRFLGLVAQEAETICPGIVTTIARTKDGDELTPEVVVPAVYETRTVPAVLDEEGEVVKPETTEQVLVTEEQVTPATYEELDDSYKGIKNDILIMKLLGAVAELSAKVAALEAS